MKFLKRKLLIGIKQKKKKREENFVVVVFTDTWRINSPLY